MIGQTPSIDVLNEDTLVHLFESMDIRDVTAAAQTSRRLRTAAEIMIMQTGILREYTEIFGIPEIQFAAPTPEQERPVVPSDQRKRVIKELSRLNIALENAWHGNAILAKGGLENLEKDLPLHPLPILRFLQRAYNIQLVVLFQIPAHIVKEEQLHLQVQKVRSWLTSSKVANCIELLGFDYNLTALPKEIEQCTALQSLILRGNHLRTLPAGLDKLPLLRRISLEKNDFKRVPQTLFSCKKLKLVELSYNQIPLLAPPTVPTFFILEGNPPSSSAPSSCRCQIQ